MCTPSESLNAAANVMTGKDYATLFGIATTLVIGIWNLVIGYRNTKKTTFINTVTNSRIKHMDALRSNIAEYIGLIHHFALSFPLSDPEKNLIREKVDRLRILIKLQLNRSHELDKEIIDKIDILPNLTDPKREKEMQAVIADLVRLTQDTLWYEWNWVKEEAKNGYIGNKPKT